MLYIQKTSEGLRVDEGYRVRTIQKGLKQFLNELLIEEHATYQGRIIALRKKYQLKHSVPLYIHENLCFYTTRALREADTLCINYFSVLSLRETPTHHTEVIFKNLHILRLEIAYPLMIRKHLQAQRLIERIK